MLYLNLKPLRRGPCVIAGDFNHPAESSGEIAIWREQGWQEIQDLALARWSSQIEMTCKGASRHDFIWLSPEAAILCCGSAGHHSFADHVVLEAKFRVSSASSTVCTWPRPACIPWEEVDIACWHEAATPYPEALSDSNATEWFRGFTQHWEQGVAGRATGPDGGLPQHCLGRAARTEPAIRDVAPSVLRASRPGEVVAAHDLLNREVKRWFQQLRRLQALRDALRGNKQTAQAMQYRAQLWDSILQARGFTPNFPDWWGRRVVQLHGSPSTITAIPDTALAQAIFIDFHENYRRLEGWHLRRREGVLAAKHAESSKHIFTALRPSKPPPLDALVLRHDFAVLAVDEASCQVQLDAAPPCHGTSCFSVEGHAIGLSQTAGALCQVDEVDLPLVPERTVIEQEQFVSEPEHVFHEFIKLWQPRWNQHSELQPEHWTRILNFTRFLRPVASFDFPPIHEAQWLRAVHRLKKHAARGPDAYARLDLLHMAPCHVTQLLQMIRAIELGQAEWPLTLLQGFVCAIDKQNHKTGADAYRPICLLSVIYRVWGSIRTKQLLRALKPHVPDALFGFVPNRETADMWMLLQARIETACAEGSALVGCMTDVVKAFNGLPRGPLLRAAARLGFPACVLTPWIAFISRVQRRFLMGEAVSTCVGSSSGFIEGDPLSVTAMSVASVLFHRYMYHFEPRIQHASYVDNLAVTAESVFLAARGHSVMESFWELLGLQLDADKTYFWATKAPDRRFLVQLGLSVAEHRRELGGFLTFGSRHRVADMTQRLDLLQPLWQALRRSKAPVCHKWTAVTAKLWPIAFHGAASCWLSDAAIGKLRTKLAWALRWTCAGAGPDLRALTEGPLELDPGFFQVWCCVRDFRRLASKSADVRRMWAAFMAGFQGKTLAGPFSTLLHHARTLNWGISAPSHIVNHRGLEHDLLMVPKRVLRRLVEEAWAHKVMRAQAHRTAIAQVGDLDVQLAREVGTSFSGQQRAWLGMVRAGAAITAAQQACFDTGRTGMCLHCQQEDTKAHRLFDCPLYARDGLQRIVGECPAMRDLLLPSWHVDLCAHLHALTQIQDEGWSRCAPLPVQSHVDLFTDGACSFGTEDVLALGAWAVICAQLPLVVASGHMSGICQTIDRCELFAVVVALRWAAAVGVGVTLWTDSQYVYDGVMQLLSGEGIRDSAHPDLWEEATELIDVVPVLYMQQVPSHVDPRTCDEPVAEFATTWNQVADRQAGHMNAMRDVAFQARHRRVLEHRRQQRRRLQALAIQYVSIAEVTSQAKRPTPDPQDDVVADLVLPHVLHDYGSFAEHFPPDWPRHMPLRGDLEHGREMLRQLIASDEAVSTKCRIPWLVLVFVFVGWGCIGFHHGRTLAYWVSCIRGMFRPLFVKFGARHWLVRDTVVGVQFPVESLIVGLPLEDYVHALSLLQDWRAGRQIKRVADLAKPLWAPQGQV